MKRLVIIVVLAGCDHVLGLASVTYVPPDAPPALVTGEYAFDVVQIGADGTPAKVEIPSPADTEIQALLLDGTDLPLTRSPDGTFSFEVPLGTTYRLVLRDSDQTTPIEVATDVRTMALRRPFYSRLDAQLPSQATLFSYNEQASTAMAGDFAAIVTTGVRSWVEESSVAAATFDWTSTGNALVSAAKRDRLIYEHGQLSAAGYYTIIETDSPPVEMIDGKPTDIGIPVADVPVALAQDRCVHLTAPAVTELGRLTSIAPLFQAGASAVWEVYSVARADMAPGAPAPLALSPSDLQADVDMDVIYGSPYLGETDTTVLQIVAERELQAPSTQSSITIADIETLYDLVTPSAPPCPNNIVHSDATPFALVASTSLAGTALTSDDQVVMLDRSHAVPFEYTLTPGAVDYVQISIYEVIAVGDMAQQTAVVPVWRYIASHPTSIDPSVLVRDHRYIIAVTVEVGFPNAKQMDFRTSSFPAGTAQMYTTMFRIAN